MGTIDRSETPETVSQEQVVGVGGGQHGERRGEASGKEMSGWALWMVSTFIVIAAIVAAAVVIKPGNDSPAPTELQMDNGALPVAAEPFYSEHPELWHGWPGETMPPLQWYTDEYERVLGTPGADWIVGDIIANRDPAAIPFPVGDMTGWPATINIVAGATPEELSGSPRSAYGYATCDVQQGGSTTYVGSSGLMMLMQYDAPADRTAVQGTACTGGEYFFATPMQLSNMLTNIP